MCVGITDEVPIFPLSALLYPDGQLSLKIFETRYLDMVSHCLRHDTPFGVCLIVEGDEVGKAAQSYRVGTLAKIVNWNEVENGVLSIDVIGCQRFRLLERKIAVNQLIKAKIQIIENVAPVVMPEGLKKLKKTLENFLNSHTSPVLFAEEQLNDAEWVSFRLAEVLPMENVVRQKLLEMDDPIERLHLLLRLFAAK